MAFAKLNRISLGLSFLFCIKMKWSYSMFDSSSKCLSHRLLFLQLSAHWKSFKIYGQTKMDSLTNYIVEWYIYTLQSLLGNGESLQGID